MALSKCWAVGDCSIAFCNKFLFFGFIVALMILIISFLSVGDHDFSLIILYIGCASASDDSIAVQ